MPKVFITPTAEQIAKVVAWALAKIEKEKENEYLIVDDNNPNLNAKFKN